MFYREINMEAILVARAKNGQCDHPHTGPVDVKACMAGTDLRHKCYYCERVWLTEYDCRQRVLYIKKQENYDTS